MSKLSKRLLPPIFFNNSNQSLRFKVFAIQILQQVIPPFLLDGIEFMVLRLRSQKTASDRTPSTADRQKLDVYWNPKMADALESWGAGTTWSELEYLMINCSGKVLDIACGTGKTIQMLSRHQNINVYGCDISDFLIQRAIDRGIDRSKLTVCDATKTDYENDFFNYSYSIGSLEHFTEDGIQDFLEEAYRITKYSSFHMIPISRLDINEGWIDKFQSYFNNSTDWWVKKFRASYDTVIVIDSSWQDRISVGKWFICIKNINLK